MDDAARLSIESACARLVTSFCNARDRRDFAAVADLFAEDVVWERPAGGTLRGKEALRGFLGTLPSGPVRHVVSNVVVDVIDEAHATGVCYVTIFRGETTDQGDSFRLPEKMVGYRDDFVRRDGRWQIAVRRTVDRF